MRGLFPASTLDGPPQDVDTPSYLDVAGRHPRRFKVVRAEYPKVQLRPTAALRATAFRHPARLDTFPAKVDTPRTGGGRGLRVVWLEALVHVAWRAALFPVPFQPRETEGAALVGPSPDGPLPLKARHSVAGRSVVGRRLRELREAKVVPC